MPSKTNALSKFLCNTTLFEKPNGAIPPDSVIYVVRHFTNVAFHVLPLMTTRTSVLRLLAPVCGVTVVLAVLLLLQFVDVLRLLPPSRGSVAGLNVMLLL